MIKVKEGYIIIHRAIFASTMLIKIPKNGDTVIMEGTPSNYKWEKWASKKLLNDKWIEPWNKAEGTCVGRLEYASNFSEAIAIFEQMEKNKGKPFNKLTRDQQLNMLKDVK